MKIFLFTKRALFTELKKETSAHRKVTCGYDARLRIYWMRRY